MAQPKNKNLQLLMGPAGSGKTNLLLHEFEQNLQNSKSSLEENSFFLVPSAEHTTRIILFLFQKGIPGFFGKRVTTLSRLARRFISTGDERLISTSERYAVIRETLESGNWTFFAPVREHPGFLQLMGHFIGEMKEALISHEQFRESADGLKKQFPELREKYEALAGFYEAYQSKLATRNLCEIQDFWIRKNRIIHNEGLPQKIWLDGFFDFSHFQLALLDFFSKAGCEMTISLTKDKGNERPLLFEKVSETEKSLKDLGFQVKELEAVNYRTEKKDLVFLERNLFGAKSISKPPQPESFTLFEAVGMQGEVEMIAREILRIKRETDCRYSDMAVLCRETGYYAPLFRAVFDRYNIPYEIHERERLKLAPCLHAVTLLLKIFREGWKSEHVFDFLKSSAVKRIAGEPKSADAVSRLEILARRLSLFSGRESWLQDTLTHPDAEAVEEFISLRKLFLAPLAELENRFRQPTSLKGLQALFENAALYQFGIFEERDSLHPKARFEQAAKRRFQSAVKEASSSMRSELPGEKLWEMFSDAFLKIVELDLYSVHDRDKNRVQVYSVSLARQKEYRFVFVAGLLEKMFPVQAVEDPLLSDDERLWIKGKMGISLTRKETTQNFERYLFYLALTRSREQVILTYPKVDREGKSALPSFYVEEVHALFDQPIKVQKQNLAHPYPEINAAISRRELDLAVWGDSIQFPFREKDKITLFQKKLLADEMTRNRFENASFLVEAQLTDPRIRAGDYFRVLRTSPTRLEEYAKCHFRYFANHVLQLQDPTDDENARNQGTILHKVLELYFQNRMMKTPDLFAEERKDDFIHREFRKALAKNPLVYEKSYQYRLAVESLEDLLNRFIQIEDERLKESNFHPAYFEWNFGPRKTDLAPALEMQTRIGPVMVGGQIDRIDQDESKRYGLVVDYKRSAEFKKDNLLSGTALQLAIYLTVAEKFLGLRPAGGELYSIKEAKRKGFYNQTITEGVIALSPSAFKLSDKEFREILDLSWQWARFFSEEMAGQNIKVRPRVCEPYCPYSSVCRIEKWKLPLIEEEIRNEDAKRQWPGPVLVNVAGQIQGAKA